MSYENLSVEERIDRAAEYALLLVADDKDVDTIVKELKEMFYLTEEQSMQAYEKMRTDHKSTYHTTVKRNNNKLLTIAVFGLLAAAGYFILGETIGDSGMGYGAIAFAVLFVLSAVAAILMLIGNIGEKYRKPAQTENNKTMQLSRELRAVLGIMLVTSLMYFFGSQENVIVEKELITIPSLVLYKEPELIRLSRKPHKHAFHFRFFETPHVYQFNDKYYDYRGGEYFIKDLHAGDTIAIQLEQDQADRSQERYEPYTIKIVNIIKHDTPYTNHVYRNKQVIKNNETGRWIGLCVLAAALIIFAGAVLYKKRQQNRSTAASGTRNSI
jgi:hypothetical protein